MTSVATAPDRRSTARSRAVLALAGGALALALTAPGGAPAMAQILATTTEPPATTEAPTTTQAPPETTAAPTTAPPVTARPATSAPVTTTRSPDTTAAPTTAPPETTTTAPPNAPATVPVTTMPVEDRARITQDTPDLGGVLTLWVLGIFGTLATLAWGWWRNQA